MNYLKYTKENGVISYLRIDGIFNIELSCEEGKCFIILTTDYNGKEQCLNLDFPLELADKDHLSVLTDEDYDLIFEEFAVRFVEIFEDTLLCEKPAVNFNKVICRVEHLVGIFARKVVEERIDKLRKFQIQTL